MRPSALRSRARGLARLLLLAAVASCSPASSPEARGGPPNLVLIVIDTLRADHLGVYGYPRPTSPAIDALARRGVVFENAFSPSSWTKPSVASLFTSRPPSDHGAVSFHEHLRPGVPTVAERLRAAGYRTLGVSGNFVHVTPPSGLARGFETWRTLRLPSEDSATTLWRFGKTDTRAPRGEEINELVLELLADRGPEPIFLYLHYMEPHPPFVPPPGARERFRSTTDPTPAALNDYLVDLASNRTQLPEAKRQWLVDLYDAEIATVDRAIGDLVEQLLDDVLGPDTVVVITSDHGEEFADHGGWFHAQTLHAELLRVPLVVVDGRRGTDGARVDTPVDLLDVAPTLLELAGLAPDPAMRGRSLLPPPEGTTRDAGPERILVAELHPDPDFEAQVGTRRQHVSLLRWPVKQILSAEGDRWTYRLDADPGEHQPLSPAGDVESEATELSRLGAAILDERSRRGATTSELDPETVEALRALGYAR